MSADRISLNNLSLADGSSGQYFAVPDGYVLDSAEKLVIGFGPDSLQSAMVSWLGWPADSALQWIWQDGFVLSDSGEVSLVTWDDEDALVLDVVQYGENGLRRTFAGREAEVALSDFESGGWSLGTSALERKEVKFGFGESYSWTQMRGGKSYELSDHLGNVAVVVGDRRLAVDSNTDLAVDFFEAEVLSARDFYPFGMVMPERSFSTQAYRYGFQGQEGDDEWLGEGNAVAFKYRVHDTRLGRFFSVDPLVPDYPWNSGYAFSENRVIDSGELEGLEKFYAASGDFLGQLGVSTELRVTTQKAWEMYHLIRDRHPTNGETGKEYTERVEQNFIQDYSNHIYCEDELDIILKDFGNTYNPKSKSMEYGLKIFSNSFTDEFGNSFTGILPGTFLKGECHLGSCTVFYPALELSIGGEKIVSYDPEQMAGTGITRKFGWREYAIVHTHPKSSYEWFSEDDYGVALEYNIPSFLFWYPNHNLYEFDPTVYRTNTKIKFHRSGGFGYSKSHFDYQAIEKAQKKELDFLKQ